MMIHHRYNHSKWICLTRRLRVSQFKLQDSEPQNKSIRTKGCCPQRFLQVGWMKLSPMYEMWPCHEVIKEFWLLRRKFRILIVITFFSPFYGIIAVSTRMVEEVFSMLHCLVRPPSSDAQKQPQQDQQIKLIFPTWSLSSSLGSTFMALMISIANLQAIDIWCPSLN